MKVLVEDISLLNRENLHQWEKDIIALVRV